MCHVCGSVRNPSLFLQFVAKAEQREELSAVCGVLAVCLQNIDVEGNHVWQVVVADGSVELEYLRKFFPVFFKPCDQVSAFFLGKFFFIFHECEVFVNESAKLRKVCHKVSENL